MDADIAHVIVVSGLPRSGTSMMMRMLEAGGLAIAQDGRRGADEDNPLGYYELDNAARIEQDASWMPGLRGRAVKLVSPLLRHLPQGPAYSVIFMRRNVAEIIASQRRMLARRGVRGGTDDDVRLANVFERHLADTSQWLAGRPDIAALDVDYEGVLNDPRPASARVARFLELPLDVDAMASAVNPSLRRQHAPPAK